MYKARFAPTIAVTALLIGVGLLASQAYSTAITTMAEPLQNPNGPLTYSSDYSGASAIVTRHESSDLTLNGSDQITGVAVQGTKAGCEADIKVDLLDASATILDTATVALPATAGAYSQVVNLTLGTTPYNTIATVSTVYTFVPIPVTLLDAWVVDGTYVTQDLSFAPSPGNNRLVVVAVTAEKNQNGPIDVDQVSLGDTVLTEIGQQVVGSATSYHNLVWLGYLDEAGIAGRIGDTVTITWTNAPSNPFGEPKVAIATYQDVDQTTPIADSSSAIDPSSATIQPGNVAVGNNDKVVYGTVAGQHYSHTALAGFYTEHVEVVGPNNDHSIAVASRDATTASTENPTATWSTSTRLGVIAAVLNACE